ncbi:MAG: VWA domain-containing protein [Sedimentisphaerales bacterium]|jgi:Mg-chelatase subunit ChlD
MTTKIDVRRKGVVLVFVAIVLVCLIGIMALALDVGYLYNIKADLQVAVDDAALAGAGGLSTDQATARARAIDIAQKNYANGLPVILQNSDVQLGLWDSVTGFTPVNSPTARANAVKVDAKLMGTKTIFAGVLGIKSVNVGASSIAVFGARDIVLTLDYSGSMSYDSQFIHKQQMGLTAVEGYLDQSWQDLSYLWQKPGSPLYGTGLLQKKTYISNNNTVILNTLGLRNVPYPYPSGSWNEYINYVKTDSYVGQAGYQNYYGYRTLLNYWQNQQEMASQTPDLWQTHEQPITAVKDAVTLFLAYMDELRTDDRLGLVSYTYTNGGGHLEQQLTDDYTLIESRSRHMQAGNYFDTTNIAGGIATALTELQTRGRTGALRLIVLLTDGQANYPDPWTAKDLARAQAQQAANNNIPILTICLGADADTELMQDIADISKGAYFVIPGGHSVDEYKQQLDDIFAQIASRRPLRLVN